ncbi:MAG: hypothetical protein ABUT20_54720 [Bacteroidota bacterium]
MARQISLPVFLFLSFNAFSGIVPDAVQKAFNARFPGVGEVSWERQHPKGFIAEFIFEGKNTKANYSFEGKWIETITEIAISELPISVKETILSFYPDWKIVVAGKIENPTSQVFYKTAIQKELRLQEIILKEEGTLLIVGLE